MSENKRQRKRKILAQGRHLRLVDEGGWEMVERMGINGIVVLVATTAKGELVLVEQYRHPVAGRVIELPAGLAGDLPGAESEELLVAAKRELLEETGYDSIDWAVLTVGPISPGLSNEVVTFFRAREAVQIEAGGGDEREEIEVHVVPLARAGAWLEARRQAGTQVDPKVYAGLYFAERG